eukprot:Tamp_22276.p1 GENE.Tamp_22276~~Tamp_22276.p1  ORF type:complete len:347 (+),score=101.94 Tamp_22276:2-1042(+)
MATLEEPIERDAMNRPIVLDGCSRGTPRERALEMDLLYPEEKVAMKDPAEALLEPGDWKKSDMFFEYRVKEGEELKTKGNGHFKAGEYAEAAVWYRKGIYYAGFDESQFNFELQDIHREQVCKVVVPLRLNYALCLLKDTYHPLRPPLPSLQDRFREAIEHCNEVLAMFNNKEAELKLQEADRVKALYRRALARLAAHDHKLVLGDLDKAKDDLAEALKAEPGNKDIRRELGTLKAKEKEEKERQRKVWSGMLENGLPKMTGVDGTVEQDSDDDAERGRGDSEGRGGAREKAEDPAAKADREQRERAEEVRAQLQRELDKLENPTPPASGGGGWGLGTLLGRMWGR